VLSSQLRLKCFESVLNSLEAGSGPSMRTGLLSKVASAPVLANRRPPAAAAAAAAAVFPALPMHDEEQDAALDIALDAGALRYLSSVFACQEHCASGRTSPNIRIVGRLLPFIVPNFLANSWSQTAAVSADEPGPEPGEPLEALDPVPDAPVRKALTRPCLRKRVVPQPAESQTEQDAAGNTMSPCLSEPASPGKVQGVHPATAPHGHIGLSR